MPTAKVLALLEKLGSKTQNIYLFSCYSGNAVTDIDSLTKGSVLITNSKKNHVSINPFEYKLTKSMVKNNRNNNPYQHFLDNINIFATTYSSFITNELNFSLVPNYEVFLDPKNALDFLNKESERFIELTKTCEWNNKRISLKAKCYTKTDIGDFIVGFFAYSSLIAEKEFTIFLMKYIKSNLNLQKLINDNRWKYSGIELAGAFNKTEVFRSLISSGIKNLKENLCGEHILSFVTRTDSIDMVILLIKAGIDVNLQNSSNKRSALHEAANSKDSIEIVKLLIKAGANVNLQEKGGFTPIFIATVCGHIEIVRCLIKAGANIDIADNYGDTSLWVACKNGYDKIAKELIRAGARIDINTLMSVATENKRKKIIRFLTKFELSKANQI